MAERRILMKVTLGRGLLAGACVLTLAFPLWAADQPNSDNTKQEKSEKSGQKSDEIKKLQEALKEKGEDPGIIDGRMGRKTHAAVRAFQKSNGLKVTGSLNPETANKLGVQLATTSGAQATKDEKK
jgi:peptidoglycan hydrolase-like protein with peptidoglycan-binding domain